MFLRGLKITLSTVALLAAAVAVYGAAQARISVTVTDTQGNPLPDAVVTITTTEITNFEKVVEVGKKGTCNIMILDATHHYLFHVEAKGYQPQERPFKVPVGSTDKVFEFQLKTTQEAAAEGRLELKQAVTRKRPSPSSRRPWWPSRILCPRSLEWRRLITNSIATKRPSPRRRNASL
ncbi:MAG: carboxypeptidase-like regulatory domain-containing protein [Acidobacteriota bacterium]